MDDEPVEATRVFAEQAVPADEAVPGSGEYVFSPEGCPTCGVALGGALSEPATANNPASLRKQADNLRRLKAAFAAGKIDSSQVIERVRDLCPVCRATMDQADLSGDIPGTLDYQAGLLDDRAAHLAES